MTTKPPARITFHQSTSGIQAMVGYSHHYDDRPDTYRWFRLKKGREFRDIEQARRYANNYIRGRTDYNYTIDTGIT